MKLLMPEFDFFAGAQREFKSALIVCQQTSEQKEKKKEFTFCAKNSSMQPEKLRLELFSFIACPRGVRGDLPLNPSVPYTVR